MCRDVSSKGRFCGGMGVFRNFFNLQNDIYLCACYNPPSNSIYFQKLNYDIIKKIEIVILFQMREERKL